MNLTFKKMATIGFLALGSMSANAILIDFTGGTVVQNNGANGVTNQSNVFQNVSSYTEDGFLVELLFNGGFEPFASIVGDYYNTGNDVLHAHWDEQGGFGNVTEIRVSKLDGTNFDLGGFAVSTNTAVGGGASIGTELAWLNSSKADEIFEIGPDSWGLGNGPDPLYNLTGNALATDISWFSFTNGIDSSSVGFGLDNFFLNEAGDPNGTDPTSVSEPATLALLGLGLAGLGFTRRQKKS